MRHASAPSARRAPRAAGGRIVLLVGILLAATLAAGCTTRATQWSDVRRESVPARVERTHIVARGETLAIISQQTGVPVARLVERGGRLEIEAVEGAQELIDSLPTPPRLAG